MRMPRIVTERADALARLEGLVVGKPLKQARADALALACYLDFYAGAADKLRGETIPYQRGYTVLILREALGVTGTSSCGTTRCRSSAAALSAPLPRQCDGAETRRGSLLDGPGLRPHRG